MVAEARPEARSRSGISLVGMTQDALEATHFLIDMDSTLVDSHRVVEWVWGEFAERHGLDRAEVLQRCIGVPAIETLRHYLDDETLAKQEFRYILDQEEGARQGIVEIPGAAAFVAALNPGQWALVTSATGTLARIRLELAGIQAPQVCVFGEDVSRGKPDPEPYRRAAEGVWASIPPPASCWRTPPPGFARGWRPARASWSSDRWTTSTTRPPASRTSAASPRHTSSNWPAPAADQRPQDDRRQPPHTVGGDEQNTAGGR